MTNDKNEMDFSGHLKNLEDAENQPLPNGDNKTLTDSELEQAGLVKTSAFVRTKKSKNALRVEKHKQKKAEQGVKQLNIEVPEQHRDIFKQIAKQLKDTGTVSSELVKAIPTDIAAKPPKATQERKTEPSEDIIELGEKCSQIVKQGGFKATILKWIVK